MTTHYLGMRGRGSGKNRTIYRPVGDDAPNCNAFTYFWVSQKSLKASLESLAELRLK